MARGSCRSFLCPLTCPRVSAGRQNRFSSRKSLPKRCVLMTRIFPTQPEADHDQPFSNEIIDRLHETASLSRQAIQLEVQPDGWLITVSSPVETGTVQLHVPMNRAEPAKVISDTRRESTFLPFATLFKGGHYAEASYVAETELEAVRPAATGDSPDASMAISPPFRLLVEKLSQVAFASHKKGDYDRAESAATEAIALCERAPKDYAEVLIPLLHLKLSIRSFHRVSDDTSTQDSLREMERLRKRSEELLGAAHSETARIMTSQARLVISEFSYYEAEDLLNRAIQIHSQARGDESHEVSEALLELAKLNAFQEKHDDAEAGFRRVLAIREKVCGPEHPDVADGLFHYTDFLIYNRGDGQRAGSLLRRAMTIWSNSIGLDHSLVVKESGFIQKVLAVKTDA